MVHIQFHLNVPCNNSPADIITAINCKHNINFIILRFNDAVADISMINIEDYTINISVYPIDVPAFIIEDLSPVLVSILQNKTFIDNIHYELFVKSHFKSNHLLMNKWLRYAQTIRGLK